MKIQQAYNRLASNFGMGDIILRGDRLRELQRRRAIAERDLRKAVKDLADPKQHAEPQQSGEGQ